MAGAADGNLDERSIAVPDAILAVRTFPRRFREALARVPPERLGERPEPDTPSAVEEAAAARDVLERLAAALPRVLDAPGTPVDALDVDPGASASAIGAAAAEPVLDAIAAACDALVSRADATPWEAWDRTFTVDGSTRPASWLVQHAAAEGSRRLRAIDQIASRFGGDAD
jgi:hypothetical protein